MKITRKVGNLCELRGVTFVKEGNGEWVRHLFMSKFFNINQTNGLDATHMDLNINGVTTKVNINKLYLTTDEKTYRAIDLKVGMTVGEFDKANNTVIGNFFTIETLEKTVLPPENRENSWMHDDVKHLDVMRVANKEDGSAIRFLLIDGVLVAKTKFSFESDQTVLSMQVVNNDSNLKKFILKTLELNLTALFELVSPLNKIVLSYNETDLKLLQLRDSNGEYLDIYNHPLVLEHNIHTTNQESLDLLNEVSEKFTISEVREKLGNLKFNSLQEFLVFLKN
jgi:hypothetical protein